MKLKVGSYLSRFYDVIDKETGKRIPLVQYANDKKGLYLTLIQGEDGIKQCFNCIKEEYIPDEELVFKNIELVGKNKFFKLLKKVIDKIQK